MVCAFVGNRSVYSPVKERLEVLLEQLIRQEGVRTFLVGDHGGFDRLVQSALARLKVCYPCMDCAIVLCSPPLVSQNWPLPTIYPQELAGVMPRFALYKQNQWMIGRADLVVTYVEDPYSNAAKWEEYARKKGKKVVSVRG